MNKEIYISTDVESDGPIPGKNSMLNFGSVALDINKNVLGTFEANLLPLPGAVQNKKTMEFWAKHPEMWKKINTDPRDPLVVMIEYNLWLVKMSQYGSPVFVAYPAGYDFTFIRWYLEYFTDDCIFGYQSLDVKSYVMALLATDFKTTLKSKFPGRWFEKDLPHTHNGIDDAMEQGMMFINILREVKKLA